MKPYIPNRLPLPVRERPKSSQPLSPRRRSRAWRRLLPLIAVTMGFSSLFVGGNILRQELRRYQDVIRTRDSRIAALIHENRNSQLKLEQSHGRLSETTAKVQSVQQQLAQRQNELAQRGKAHETTQLSLLKVQEQLIAVEADRKRLAQEGEQIRSERQAAAERTVQQMLSLGEVVAADPSLTLDIWQEAIHIADSHGIEQQPIRERMERLPSSRILPVGTSVLVSDLNHNQNDIHAHLIVRDATGQSVAGLTRADVNVYDGQRRLHAVALTETRRNAYRHDLALLLDTSGSTKGLAQEALKAAAMRFIRSLANPSRLRVWRFADEVDPLTPWTFDADLHEQAIASLTANGATSLYKALRLAVEDVKERNGSRAIVLFTDGSDSFKSESLDATLDLCRQHSIPIHVVALQTAETSEDILRRIAMQTNGTYHVAADPSQLVEQFRDLSQSFQQPIYRLHVYESADSDTLTVRVGDLPPVALTTRR